MDNYTDRLRTDGSPYDNNLILRTSDNMEIELINVKIDVTQQNKIVETALVHHNGKVKEFIQKEDYSIKVTGDLIGDKDKFPYELLNTLLTILNEQESFSVASPYLELFGIDKVALKRAMFNQGTLKYFNVMPFILSFVSDEDYKFLVSEQ